MQPKPTESQSHLRYAAADALFPRRKSLLETTGFHYVSGLGASTLGAALLLLWRYRADYPPTFACGGIFVVVIQWVLVALPALWRGFLLDQPLEERSSRLTVICGLCGGALVFGTPVVIRNIATGPIAVAGATLVPLCIYPVAVSFLIFRRMKLVQR